MDSWNTTFLLGSPIFRGYVSFREGKRDDLPSTLILLRFVDARTTSPNNSKVPNPHDKGWLDSFPGVFNAKLYPIFSLQVIPSIEITVPTYLLEDQNFPNLKEIVDLYKPKSTSYCTKNMRKLQCEWGKLQAMKARTKSQAAWISLNLQDLYL